MRYTHLAPSAPTNDPSVVRTRMRAARATIARAATCPRARRAPTMSARARDVADDASSTASWCRYEGRFLSSSEAAALDEDLIAGVGCEASSLESLMRTAGKNAATATLARAVGHERFVVLCGPGNNGGDGLVLAREVATRRETSEVKVWYPKGPGKSELYAKLVDECRETRGLTFVDEQEVLKMMDARETRCFVDAMFGFSFRGEVRAPFVEVMKKLTALTNGVCADLDERALFTVSLDIPSGWNVDGAPSGGEVFTPNLLISLTAPKKCCATFDDPALGERTPRMKRMAQTHVVAGTFLTEEMCEKYGLRAIPLRHDSVEEYAPLDLSRKE